MKKQNWKIRPKETNRLFRKIKKLNFLCGIVIFSFLLIIWNQNNFVFGDVQLIDGYQVETIAENLKIPWAIAFSPDGRIFFTEREGNVRVIENNELLPKPIKKFDVGGGEGGLLGIAIDPNFEENHFIYLYYTYSEFFTSFNKVVRFTEVNNELINEVILIDKIPGQFIHDGGRMKFGPDEKLYITTGEAGNSGLAQDLNSLGGKILRINRDGTIPDDNPFLNSPVYSLGHRNPQGIDWDPKTGSLVISEHGPTGERGFAQDEINVIEPGKNYGWPNVVGDENQPQFTSPIIHSGSETWAPSGASFYDSDNISEWTGKFFVATLRGKHLRVLDMDIKENIVLSSDVLFLEKFGRLRDASVGPDGNLYLLTSNQDGRGTPELNDDRILRIISEPITSDKISGDPSLSPLKQIQLGVLPIDVQCKQGLDLVLKKSDKSPACVFVLSSEKLISRGWAIRT